MSIYDAAPIMVPVMVIILLLSIFFYWRRMHRFDKVATGTVIGKISDIDDEENYEGTARRYFWIIVYQVDSTEYKLRQQHMRILPLGVRKQMEEHLFEEVTVHYDPNAPKKAWAETPDRIR